MGSEVTVLTRRWGPYRELKRLGAGGMGAVWEVGHDSTGVRYALKLLLPTTDAEDAIRFVREAQTLSSLRHPNVVRVHAGDLAGDTPYLVQELCVESLQGRLEQRGPLPIAEVRAITEDLIAGLRFIHARGYLHRDLKPANVLFSEAGTAKLADFGLVRRLSSRSMRLTETGVILGTPAYMAPEQAQSSKDCGTAADVYALGAIVYACLAGRGPFSGSGLGALPLLLKIQREAPTPIGELRPDTPLELQRLCARCLAKDPRERPTLRELAASLGADGARAPSRRLRPWVVASACLLLVGLVALAALPWWPTSPQPGGRAPTLAGHQELPPEPAAKRAAPRSTPPLSRPRLRLGWQAARDRAKSLLESDDLDEAIRHFDHARALAPERELLPLEGARLKAYAQRMARRRAEQRLDEAADDCDAILAALEWETLSWSARIYFQMPYGMARALRMRLLLAEGDLQGALRESELCLQALPTHYEARHVQAWIEYRSGDAAKARRLLRACCLDPKKLEWHALHEPRGYLLLATIARERGDEARAQELLDLVAQSLHPRGRREAAILGDPGRREQLRRQLEAARQERPPTADAWIRRGELAWALLEFEEAESAFAAALALRPGDVQALTLRADLALELEDWPLAARLGRELATEGSEARVRAAGLRVATKALLHLSRPAEAREAAQLALSYDPDLAGTDAEVDLARALSRSGDVDAGRAILQRVGATGDPHLLNQVELLRRELDLKLTKRGAQELWPRETPDEVEGAR